MTRYLILLATSLAWSSAVAEPTTTLRMASEAPEGTPWARELHAMGDLVATRTNGAVRVKWYFGAVTEDEKETAARVERRQLDGMAGGGPVCEQISPSMRVLGIPGLFQSRDEAAHVMHRLLPTLADESRLAGYELVMTGGLGPTVIFSRTPIRTMAELRATRSWEWELSTVEVQSEKAMGLNLVPANLHAASRLYDTKAVDAFIAIPAAALAFQWSTQAKYVTNLRLRYLTGCIVVASRAFNQLPLDQQEMVRDAFARRQMQFEEAGRRIDDQLLGGVFARQGLSSVPVSETFRAQFFEAARQAREKLGEQLVPSALLSRVLQMLVDYRAAELQAVRKN